MFPAHIRNDAKVICQFIAPKASGNTAFNGIIERPTHFGMEIVLIEAISPYGVKLDEPTGGWYRGLEGWFSNDCFNAVGLFIKGQGGHKDNMSVVREQVAEQAVDNPLRQQILIDNLSEVGT